MGILLALLALVLLGLFVTLVVVGIVITVVVITRAVAQGVRGRATDSPGASVAAAITIADAPEHTEVRIAGRVRALGPSITGPLSGEPVVAFRVVIEVLHRGGAHAVSEWRVEHVEEHIPDLLVVDATGEARVTGLGSVELDTAAPRRESFGGFTSPSDAARAFMGRVGFEPSRFLTVGLHRLTEHRLVEGDHVEVSGRVRACDSPAVEPSTQGRRIVIEPGVEPVRIRCTA